jgi:hypothetical protein
LFDERLVSRRGLIRHAQPMTQIVDSGP